jgi:hypothetical protein
MNTATEHLGALGTAVALPTGEISSAQLWELHGQEWLEASNAPDIYELLDKWGNTWETATHHPHAFAVLTTGWAAPLGDNGEVEGQPSKHPKRRRVVLFCVVSADGSLASRMVFGDDPEPVDDDGSASGALAEALDIAALRVWGRSFVLGLFKRYDAERDGLTDSQRETYSRRLAGFMLALGAGDGLEALANDDEDGDDQ